MNGHIDQRLAEILDELKADIDAAMKNATTDLAASVGIERAYRKHAPEYLRLREIKKKDSLDKDSAKI